MKKILSIFLIFTLFVVGLSETYVLIIGSGDFDDSSIVKLPGAIKDAQAFKKTVIALGIAKENNIMYLENPTVAKMKIAIKEWARKAMSSNDELIFYYSGHGYTKNGKTYLVAYDTYSEYIEDSAVDITSLLNQLKSKIKTNKILIIMDACYAGSLVKDRPLKFKRYEKVSFDDLKVKYSFLLSSKGDQTSKEREKGGGWFTYYLIKGIQGAANENEDEYITLKELYEYIEKEVSKVTKGQQTPILLASKDILVAKDIRSVYKNLLLDITNKWAQGKISDDLYKAFAKILGQSPTEDSEDEAEIREYLVKYYNKLISLDDLIGLSKSKVSGVVIMNLLLVAPQNKAVLHLTGSDKVELMWSGSPSDMEYTVYISSNSSDLTTKNATVIQTKSNKVSLKLKNGKYFWKVVGKYKGKVIESKVWQFEVSYIGIEIVSPRKMLLVDKNWQTSAVLKWKSYGLQKDVLKRVVISKINPRAKMTLSTKNDEIKVELEAGVYEWYVVAKVENKEITSPKAYIYVASGINITLDQPQEVVISDENNPQITFKWEVQKRYKDILIESSCEYYYTLHIEPGNIEKNSWEELYKMHLKYGIYEWWVELRGKDFSIKSEKRKLVIASKNYTYLAKFGEIDVLKTIMAKNGYSSDDINEMIKYMKLLEEPGNEKIRRIVKAYIKEVEQAIKNKDREKTAQLLKDLFPKASEALLKTERPWSGALKYVGKEMKETYLRGIFGLKYKVDYITNLEKLLYKNAIEEGNVNVGISLITWVSPGFYYDSQRSGLNFHTTAGLPVGNNLVLLIPISLGVDSIKAVDSRYLYENVGVGFSYLPLGSFILGSNLSYGIGFSFGPSGNDLGGASNSSIYLELYIPIFLKIGSTRKVTFTFVLEPYVWYDFLIVKETRSLEGEDQKSNIAIGIRVSFDTIGFSPTHDFSF